ncbi:twin-arginine translocase TatA/TatE family subunit [Jeotgalibacillus proteolyticus]|uniref:Sec-independent protein translocase protein TatA n=1 Tax=Jeotgalibacillus proteolyticus TaxID=2082395 RepID=A0A2S5GHN2_9BACL|nr:twin-arginine translocase TatA/TatE family subunit [Jeotgalibacillus proteolyticus]PPA72434.1 twin-arginine translocase TatA/TatE family subunit [Jeotgalibacillus proteolyticus]
MSLGFGEIVIILFAALIVFGPKKLPELGRTAGLTLREFKKALNSESDKDRTNHK